MLFKIETRNPYNGEIEHYADAGKDENEAKINFLLKFLSHKVRNICYIEGNVVKMNVNT